MRNLCNKANVPYLLAGAFATLTLIASGALVAAPYVGFLSSVAAFNVALPVALSLFALSVLVLAFSYKMVKKVEVEKNKFAEKEQELENKVTLEKEATSRVRQLTEENQYLKSDIERLNETKDQLEKQLTYAQKKSEDELSDMRKQKEIIERQAEEQKIRVQQELNQKTQGLDDVKQQLETSNKNIGVIQKKVDELRGRLKESEDYRNKLQEVLEAKENELDNVKRQKVQLEQKLENTWNLEYSNDPCVSLQEDLKVKQDKVELLEGQISQIEASMKQAIGFYELSGNDLRNVEGSASVGSKFEEFLILLSIDDTEKRLRLRVLTEENQDLKDQLGNWEEKVALSKDLESSLLDTRQQLSETIQEKEFAEKKMKESDEWEVVARKNSIKRSEEASELKRKLHQEALLRKNAEKKVEELKSEVEQIKIESSKLSHRLSQEMSLRKDVEKKVEELDDILSQKTQRIDKLKRRITELEDESLSMMGELSQQYIENRHLSESLERLENKVGKGESGALEVMAAKAVEDECEGASKLLVGGEQSKTELEEVQLQGGLQQVNASEAEDEQSRKDSNEESEDLLIKSDDQQMKALVSSAKESRERDKLDSESYEFLCEPDVKNQFSSEGHERLENELESLNDGYKKGESSRSEVMVTKAVEDEREKAFKLVAEDEQSKKDSNEGSEGSLHKLDQKAKDFEAKISKSWRMLDKLKDEGKAMTEQTQTFSLTSTRVLNEMKKGRSPSVNKDQFIKAKDRFVKEKVNLEHKVEYISKICADLGNELNKKKNKTRVRWNGSCSEGSAVLRDNFEDFSRGLNKAVSAGQLKQLRKNLDQLGKTDAKELRNSKSTLFQTIIDIQKETEGLDEIICRFYVLFSRKCDIYSLLGYSKSRIKVQNGDSLPSSGISFPNDMLDIKESTPVGSSDVSDIASTPSRLCEGLEKGCFSTHLSPIQHTEISSTCNSTLGKSDQSILESRDQEKLKKKHKRDKENSCLQSQENHSMRNVSVSPLRNTTNILAHQM